MEENSEAKKILDEMVANGDVYQDPNGSVVIADDPPSKRKAGRPKKGDH